VLFEISYKLRKIADISFVLIFFLFRFFILMCFSIVIEIVLICGYSQLVSHKFCQLIIQIVAVSCECDDIILPSSLLMLHNLDFSGSDLSSLSL